MWDDVLDDLHLRVKEIGTDLHRQQVHLQYLVLGRCCGYETRSKIAQMKGKYVQTSVYGSTLLEVDETGGEFFTLRALCARQIVSSCVQKVWKNPLLEKRTYLQGGLIYDCCENTQTQDSHVRRDHTFAGVKLL